MKGDDIDAQSDNSWAFSTLDTDLWDFDNQNVSCVREAYKGMHTVRLRPTLAFQES